MKNLLIISDTPIWFYNQKWFVHSPTLREIERLEIYFDRVTWIGYLQKGVPSKIASVSTTKIQFSCLPPSGGNSFRNKFIQALLIPLYTIKIYKHSLSSNYIHARGPSVPAIIICILGKFIHRRRFWFKYAGNWVQKNKPLLYRMQKALYLQAKFAKVSINGAWPNTPRHVYSFPNPSFTVEEQNAAVVGLKYKKFDSKKDILFVGRLDAAKGVMRLLAAIKDDMALLGSVHIVGNGCYEEEIIKMSKRIPNLFIHGNLGRKELINLYSKCHLIVLPTLSSEGFPKVVAEAAVHGCIPVVTALSSISQYVEDEYNGFLIAEELVNSDLKRLLLDIIRRNDLEVLAYQSHTSFTYFSYESYLDHLRLIGFIG